MGFWDLGDHFPDRPEPPRTLRIVSLHEQPERLAEREERVQKGFKMKPRVMHVVLPARKKPVR